MRTQYKVQGGDLGHAAGGFDEERITALCLNGKAVDASQHKSVGWARKMIWVAFQRSSAEKLVGEFEAWTERVRLLLEAAWWPLSFFETLERIRSLETDEDARTVGLLRGISLRKLLASPPELVSAQSAATEISSRTLGAIGQIDRFDICHKIDNSGKRYLVEYKYYLRPQGASGPAFIVSQRVVQLAALLHDAPVSDTALSVLQCKHYFHDMKNSRFGLVFALTSPEIQPQALPTLLDVKQGIRASLGQRMKLAHMIYSTRIHGCISRFVEITFCCYRWTSLHLLPNIAREISGFVQQPTHCGLRVFATGIRLFRLVWRSRNQAQYL